MKTVLALSLAGVLAFFAPLQSSPRVSLYERAAQSAVFVDTDDGQGSGTYLGDGLILTARHVAPLHSKATVSGLTGGEVRAVSVWDCDKLCDLALLRVEGDPGFAPRTAALACGPLAWGQPIHYVGHPFTRTEHKFLLFVGVLGNPLPFDLGLSLPHPDGGSALHVVQGNISARPGASGSGVFDAHGNVIGVISAVDTITAGPFGGPQGVGSTWITTTQALCALKWPLKL